MLGVLTYISQLFRHFSFDFDLLYSSTSQMFLKSFQFTFFSLGGVIHIALPVLPRLSVHLSVKYNSIKGCPSLVDGSSLTIMDWQRHLL